ncbi:hypothetical protein B0A48_09156 [Cryoendolithus antarcticus]|uniref:3-hydroxyacyl-CoA dehydrogenase C-terminal domain-containing protein n=1 Tax=Cryoendolithus antarcticus TaxID=1507870 RepID=A0A1V8T2D9_9PEZI|nr:hypothetical protein B0A48_09156 [Cryoendolithus antarcticus]
MASAGRAVTLLGAGTQGRRLAFMWSRQGRPVHLVDKDQNQLDRAYEEIQKYQSTWTEQKPSKWGEVRTLPAESLEDAVSDSWLVLECVPEKLALKRETIQKMHDVSSPSTVIASNSSSYTIDEIIQGLDLKNTSRCVSLHSYWPPETSAIEVMGTPETPSHIIDKLMSECSAHGFSPFHVRKSSTGYIYNRIWAAIKRETLLTLSEGVATPAEIDGIFKDVLKTPKGPCEQMDVVGLDVVRDIEKHYADVRDGVPTEPRRLLDRYIAEKKLGVKSESGFYEWKDGRRVS